MVVERRNGWDPLAAIASAIALGTIAWYLAAVHQQGGGGVVWFPGGLALAAVLCAYSAAPRSPRRAVALVVSGVLLAALGLVAILSVGLPVAVAAVLAFVAAARRGTSKGDSRFT